MLYKKIIIKSVINLLYEYQFSSKFFNFANIMVNIYVKLQYNHFDQLIQEIVGMKYNYRQSS